MFLTCCLTTLKLIIVKRPLIEENIKYNHAAVCVSPVGFLLASWYSERSITAILSSGSHTEATSWTKSSSELITEADFIRFQWISSHVDFVKYENR